MHGAAHHVHIDAGLNAVQMEDIQMELQQPQDDVPLGNGQDAWPEPNQGENEIDQEEDIQKQGSISFDQSGSTAEYLRAHGPDIFLNLDDVLKGKFQTTESSSSSTSEASSSFQSTSVKGRLSGQFQALDLGFWQINTVFSANIITTPNNC